MSLTVQPNEPGMFDCVIEYTEPRPSATLASTLQEALDKTGLDFTESVAQLWLPAVDNDEDAIVAELGFTPYRDLWQLRVDLPLVPTDRDPVDTRAFTDDDTDAFIQVNNRAFAWHPEQGGMTRADVEQRQTEPWYDADMFRLHERDGQLAGFNWLKVHRPETGGEFDPPMGEIYVIAVDPDFHGLGLGMGLSRAGLDHLAAHGLTRAMLYVESDNEAANRVYTRIGFTHHQTNRAYRLGPPPSVSTPTGMNS